MTSTDVLFDLLLDQFDPYSALLFAYGAIRLSPFDQYLNNILSSPPQSLRQALAASGGPVAELCRDISAFYCDAYRRLGHNLVCVCVCVYVCARARARVSE